MRYFLIPLFLLSILAQWTSCTSELEKTISALESADTLQYEIQELVFKDEQFSNDPAIQSKYSFTYFEFRENLPPAAKDSLLALKATFLAGSEKTIHVMPDFKKMANDLFKEFADNAGQYSPYAGWEISRSVIPSTKIGILQSIECSEMSYLGGAHPNSVWFYKVVDLSDGRTVKLNDIVDPNQMEAFNRLRFKSFEESWKSRGEDLDWRDYYFAESFVKDGPFYTNENFKVGKVGLTFFYNQYEIAPYAAGTTEVLLTWKELEPMLLRDGKYYKYFSRKDA